MIKAIKTMIERIKESARQKRVAKYLEIRRWVIRFYEDLNGAEGGVQVPAWVRAERKLREVIRNNRDVDYYFKKLERYKLSKI